MIKVKKIVLMAIRGNTQLRKRIKDILDISEPTLYRIITENDPDLTQATVLRAIREELNLSDAEILEESEELKASNQ